MLALALVVAGASIMVAAGALSKQGAEQRPSDRLPLRLGLALIAVVLAITVEELPERVLWAGASVLVVAEWVVTSRHPKGDVARSPQIQPGERLGSGTGPSRVATLGRNLERLRPLWVFALVPSLILGNGRFVPAGIVIMALLWAVTGVTSGQWGRKSAGDGALILLLLALPGALLVSPFRDLTQEHLGYFVAQVAAFWSVYCWARTGGRMALAGQALAAVGAGFSVLCILLMEPSSAAGAGSSQAAIGETVQRNVAAGTLVVLMPVALAVFLGVWGKGRVGQRLFYGLYVLICGLGIGLAQSRGALVALLVALAVMLICVARTPRWLVPAGATLLVVASLSATLVLPTLGDVGNSASSDIAIRVEIWSRAGQAIVDYPLTGIGLGAFREVMPALYPYLIAVPERVNHAHNLYLQIGSDLGLVGLIGFIALTIVLLARASANLSNVRGLAEPRLRWLAAGCIGGLIGMLVHGTVDAVTWGVRPTFLAWSVLGLLLALGSSVESADERLAHGNSAHDISP